jgi:hypothetical protein
MNSRRPIPPTLQLVVAPAWHFRRLALSAPAARDAVEGYGKGNSAAQDQHVDFVVRRSTYIY